jgi:hypothetical protein
VKETFEFRIPEKLAAAKLPGGSGRTIGYGVRVVRVGPDDRLFAKIGRQERKAREHGEFFFASWDVRRSYGEEELEAASFLRLRVSRVFEPAGEECGTVYDEERACPLCRSGARQAGPLILRASTIPRVPDISMTIAGEVVVSEAFRLLFEEEQMSGAEFGALQRRSRGHLERHPHYHQLLVPGPHPAIDERTNVGVDPFTRSTPEEKPCPNGDLLGLNLISELWLRAGTVPDRDIMTTRQYIGTRRGLLRPERVIIVSQRLAVDLKRRGLKGLRLEPVHLVE